MQNKKYYILVFFFILLNSNAFSQAKTGFMIGGNMSYLTGDLALTNSQNHINPQKILKPGLQAGIFWDIKTGYNSFIQIGGFYSQQGSLYKTEIFRSFIDSMQIEKYTYTRNNSINYFKVPFLWKQQWGDWYTKLGFWGAYAIQKKATWEGFHEFSTSTRVDSGEYTSFAVYGTNYDFGMTFSLGFQIPINRKNDFFICMNYNHGLLVYNPDAIREEERMYNRYFTLSTGIIFGKAKGTHARRR